MKRGKVLLYKVYMNFTNTQLKTVNTQFILHSRVNTKFHKNLIYFSGCARKLHPEHLCIPVS